jgi:hypothetical protein
MKYYIVTAKLADRLGVKPYRFGNNTNGYLVNQSDLAVIGIEEAVNEGARGITEEEAKTFKENL